MGGAMQGDSGDWICPACGNSNYASRTVCNMRKCGKPRPDNQGMGMDRPRMDRQYDQGPPPMQNYGMQPVFHEPPRQFDMPYGGGGYDAPPHDDGGKGGGKGREEGDWKCLECGNVNFAFRTTCNMRKCGAPKPRDGYDRGPQMNQMQMQMPPFQAFYEPPPPTGMMGPYNDGGGKGGKGEDWTCPECGNVNFASRQVCNMRKCQAPKPAPQMPMMGGGMPPPMGGMMGGPPPYHQGPPDWKRGRPDDWHGDDGMGKRPRMGPGGHQPSNGDWVCPKCNNLNFASREVCNMRSCKEPKPPMHNGILLRPGEWVCPKCSNINFASRTVCNMRSCGAAKPGSDKAEEEKS